MQKHSSVILLIFLVNLFFIGFSLDLDVASGSGLPIEGNWTWINGNDTINQGGVYSDTNTPEIIGGRSHAVSWIGPDGKMWLFGGIGYGLTTSGGALNDLWVYNPQNDSWKWMPGNSTPLHQGVYGTKGIPNASNVPCTRYGAMSWSYSDCLYLFGGWASAYAPLIGMLNDLWRYNLTTGLWTWISGSNSPYDNGTYGIQGIPSSSNIPSSRENGASWNHNEMLYLFGGYGNGSTSGEYGRLNDLWTYNITSNEWTWISGSSSINQSGVYGTIGDYNPNNIPSSRTDPVSWIINESLYLFGGYGYDS